MKEETTEEKNVSLEQRHELIEWFARYGGPRGAKFAGISSDGSKYVFHVPPNMKRLTPDEIDELRKFGTEARVSYRKIYVSVSKVYHRAIRTANRLGVEIPDMRGL